MKIIFKRQEISNKLAPLMSVVSGKNTLTAVEGILIEANSPDFCTLTAFDLEKGMKITAQCEVIEEGSYIINAQKFNQTLKVMDGEYITLTVDEKLQATFECGISSHKMGALRSEDFPEIPRLTTEKGFVISQGTLKRMLSKVSYAMGINDTTRPMLNGCYIKTEQDKLNVVACDSFKLAVCSCPVRIENIENSTKGIEYSFIVPSKSVNEIIKLLSDDDEENVTIYMSYKNMILVFDDLIFFTKLITAEYIDYDKVIIKNHKIQVVVDKNELIASLEKASLITEERIERSVRSHVLIVAENDLIKVSAVSAAGSIYDEVETQHTGESISIAFNNRFLIDSVKACSYDKIKISMSSPFTRVNIEPAEPNEGESELFMVPPVRTRS